MECSILMFVTVSAIIAQWLQGNTYIPAEHHTPADYALLGYRDKYQ